MKKYRKAKSKYIAVCSLTLWLYQPVNAQIEITTLPDSVINGWIRSGYTEEHIRFGRTNYRTANE